MRSAKTPIITALWVGLLAAGCGAIPYTADVSELTISPPSLLTARPIARRLFVVLRESQVPDDFPIRSSSHSVRGFRGYLGRALERALGPYFESVEIRTAPLSAEELAAAGPAAIADVRVDGVEARNLPAGGYVYSVLRMQWSFAIRPAEAEEYLFSFAGDGNSEHAYNTLEDGLEQMLLSAIGGLMEGWTEEEVFQRFRRLEGGGTSADAAMAPLSDESDAPAE